MALIASLPHTSKLNTDYNLFSDVVENDNRLLQEINGSLSNSNIAANAAISPSKLANGTEPGQVMVTNSTGVYATRTVEGHVTMNASGQVTISDGVISTAKIADGAVTTAKLSVNLDSTITSKRLDQFAVPTSSVSFNSQRITNVAAPTSSTDAATKGYADGLAFSSGSATPDADATTKGKIQLAGDLSGSAASPQIATGAISTSKLADGAVTSAKLDSGVLSAVESFSPFFLAGL